ncbi:hypothetical protein PBV87_12705 [Niameybacter massiliensis]|uniref:Uncharacterized protein n=1 Tax=Holtiella tumoricola TaxID=3018743 RepID=A0AA42J1L1_9FIRM|nr:MULTISPECIES: hypothetical protein [Lachnospirales]MDA3732348.1 hypothetical protein [Holtiella tumoricola]
MKVIYTVNGKDLDSYSKEEQKIMLTKMLINAVHKIGYEFVNPIKDIDVKQEVDD